MTYEEQQKKLRGFVPQGTAGATELQNQGFNDVGSLINSEMINNNQDPFNLEGQDEGTLQRILSTIESQINQPQQNQQSILDILTQQQEVTGLKKIQDELFGLRSAALPVQQAQQGALEQVQERPLTGTILTGGLESELQNIAAGKTAESLPRIRALREAGEREKLLLGREETAREEAKFRTGLLETERKEQREEPTRLLGLAKDIFGIKQGVSQEKRAEKALTLQESQEKRAQVQFQAERELDPLKKQQLQAQINNLNAETAKKLLETTSGGNVTLNERGVPIGSNGRPIDLEAGDKKLLDAYNSVDNIVDKLELEFKKVSSPFPTAVGARIFGTVSKLGQKIGLADPNVRAWEGLINSQIGPVARSVSQEVGVLTDKDIERAKSALPSITDSTAEATLKLRNLRQIVGANREDFYSRLGVTGKQQVEKDPLGVR